MTVVATCAECSDEHPLGDRPRDESKHSTCTTTLCPSCGAQSYRSKAVDGTVKTCDERISDAVSDVYGVGEQTLANIQAYFDTYVELETADKSVLTEIEGVGAKAASKIADQV